MKSIMFNGPKTWRRKANRWPAITRLSFWTLIKPHGFSGGQLAIDDLRPPGACTHKSALPTMSALPTEADMGGALGHVGLGPTALH
jgi:hypothetical protein